MFDNGESKREIQNRMLSAMNSLICSPHNNIAISSHGYAIVNFIHNFNKDINYIENGNIIHICYSNNKWIMC